MQKEQLKKELLHKASGYIEDAITMHNALTGDNKVPLYTRLKQSIRQAQQIDIIVSFLMESGVKLLIEDLKEAVARGVKIRLLTGDYLNITQPSALYMIREALGEQLDLRLYNVKNKSFHPKAYIFHGDYKNEIYIGSSNLSRGALTTSVEWNYRFEEATNTEDFGHFMHTFEQLFYEQATPVDDKVLRNYSKAWTKPKIFQHSEEERHVIPIYEPRGAQIEALYALKQTREEGWDRGLVVAATGIGKTYLSAFDSKSFKKVLFVGHREEILKQAAISFKNVREIEDVGFFYNGQKDIEQEVILGLVQTLGKQAYLNERYFKEDTFDYIIVDECHHAVAKNYEAIRQYFKPKFWLFLTATPERMDNADVFEIAHWNTVYEVRLKEAINKGWLVPFRYYGIYDDTVNYDQIAFQNGKYNAEQLEESLMIHQRAELVLKHYQKYGSKCAMGFCTSRQHADYMATYFNERGVPAVAVYSGDPGAMYCEREKALKDLVSGQIAIIFSVDMFNEGIDVPELDMVLFLRPTQSSTIFLQQLGRGLRKAKGKSYVNVLDFIGNYKKAQLIPFLLSDSHYTPQKGRETNPQQMIVPEDCLIDFDFRLIDLFKQMATHDMKRKDKIQEAYQMIKDELGERPSRIALIARLEETMYMLFKKEVLRDYIGFLAIQGDLTKEEKQLIDGVAGSFIQLLQTTSMSKTYKMPLLLAFYNQGNIRLKITEQQAIEAFKVFYTQDSHSIDLLQHKSTANYQTWDDARWLKLIRDNPRKFLLQTHSNFFKEEEGYFLVLDERLEAYSHNEMFRQHVKDAIDLRVAIYYRDRFVNDKKREE